MEGKLSKHLWRASHWLKITRLVAFRLKHTIESIYLNTIKSSNFEGFRLRIKSTPKLLISVAPIWKSYVFSSRPCAQTDHDSGAVVWSRTRILLRLTLDMVGSSRA